MDDSLSMTSASCPLIESLILSSCLSIGVDGLSSLHCLRRLTLLDLSYTFLTNLQPVFDTCSQLVVSTLIVIWWVCLCYSFFFWSLYALRSSWYIFVWSFLRFIRLELMIVALGVRTLFDPSTLSVVVNCSRSCSWYACIF